MNKYQKYRYRWETYPTTFRVDKVPIHLDIELTTRCNLSCIMCEYSFNPPEPMDMPFKMVKRIIDEFVRKGGSSMKFCYLGEPLLYKKLAKVIRYAKKKGIVETIVSTNGNLLTTEKSIELIKAGLDYIIFSVDSIYPERYQRIRYGGSLSKVIKGIVGLQTLKELMRTTKPKIQVQAIPIKKYNVCNYIELDTILDQLYNSEYELYWKDIADIVRISPHCEDYNNTEIIGETPNFICPSVFRRMTVRANGDIAVCCGARIDSKIIGNIKNMSIQEAWLSKKFINIRKAMKNGKSHLIECCKTCSIRRHG